MTEFGALMFPTDYAMKTCGTCKAIEEREMDSTLFPEHTHPRIEENTIPRG